MNKFLGLFLAGVLVAPITAARAHDMADMAEMSHPVTQIAAVEPNTVTIDNFNFGPNMLTVAPGTTVTWVNRDGEPHTVVSAAASTGAPPPAVQDPTQPDPSATSRAAGRQRTWIVPPSLEVIVAPAIPSFG